METKFDEKEIKEEVKQRYAGFIAQPGASSCCGPGSTSMTEKLWDNLLAKMAGYSKEELQKLPREVVENAFGCGNPLAFAEVKAGQVVLDIGSGVGIDCLLAAEKVGPTGKVIGLDMTPEMIDRARENAAKAGVTNVEFRIGDAEDMPLENNSVDWVISNCVINLAPAKDKVFREIFRVLKPGGRVSISDIVSENLPQEVRQNMKAWASCIGGTIPEKEYIARMEKAGLQDVYVASRFVYDEKQVSQFIFGESSKINFSLEDIALYNKYKDQLGGKVWSARFSAKKPIKTVG